MSTGAKRAYANGSFTGAEATSKLGKHVYLLSDLSRFRKGATGNVVDFHEKSDSGFEVIIRWNSFNGSEPVYEGFSKSRYHQFFFEGDTDSLSVS
jgi:hypothetical protein